jgi:hypothetical protein
MRLALFVLKCRAADADTKGMKKNLTWAIALAAAIAVLASATAGQPPQRPRSAPAKPAARPAPSAPLIATPSPTPVSTASPVVAVAPLAATPILASADGTAARQAIKAVSSLPQYITLGLDSAPVARVAPVAVIDTAVAASGRAFGGRVHVIAGSGQAGVNEHGSLISAAITSSYSPLAHSNGGAATGSYVVFSGCALSGGIDLDCALTALEGASGVRAVNMSFETGAAIPADVDARWQRAVDAARARGIVVVAAAGDGPGLPFPARLAGVVSVSRTTRAGVVVNPAARAAAPGSSLVVVNAAGGLVGTSGSSYSSAYITAIVARLAGARPSLSADQLAAAVSGRTTITHAARIAGVRVAAIGRPGCLRVSGRGRRTLRWGTAAKAVAFRVQVGRSVQLVHVRALATSHTGFISVRALGPYGAFGPPALAC